MFDKDLNSYLRTANRALPCGAAHIAFARYVNEVAQDVLRNDPGADFAAVTEQLGPTPRQAAEDFVDSTGNSLFCTRQRTRDCFLHRRFG